VTDLKEGCILITDNETVTELPGGNFRVFEAPVSRIAREDIGKLVVTNIVALGILTRITGVASEDSVEKAILNRVPAGTEELNRRAFKEGLKMGETLLEDS